MILYYAPGGGLGHLTRGRRVLEALGVRDAAFVTPSEYAQDARVVGPFSVVRCPSELDGDVDAHRTWMRNVTRGAERLLVDTFPCGIQGELSGLDVPIDLVARLLRWPVYRSIVPSPLPRIATTYVVEELTPDHAAALSAVTDSIEPLDLTPTPRTTDNGQRTTPYWLLVHSGPESEVHELASYAQELLALEPHPPAQFLAVTPCPVPPPFERVDAYPAAHLYAGADKIITAAGFNTMLETRPWTAKHAFLPFRRTFDDQFLRASRRRAAAKSR